MRASLALAALCLAFPAAAQVRAVPDQPASAEAAAKGVVVYLMNEGGAAAVAEAPDTIAVTAQDGARLTLRRNSVEATSIAAGGFARAFYTLDRGAPPPVAVAAIPPAELPVTGGAPAAPREASVLTSKGTSSAFLHRFRPLEPIYGAWGLGDAGAKLQFSVGVKPFAGDGPLSWLSLGYTQTIFWAIDRPSGPVRATNYSPEVFLDIPVESDTVLGIGYRHDSNGERSATSVNSHRIVARIAHRYPLGRGWTAELAPEAWFFLGSKGVATDLEDYLGYTGLRAAIWQDQGLKVALSGRGNPGTCEGALEPFVSYPLVRLGVFGVSVFGQAFTGAGEALTDYNVDDTNARLGIAFYAVSVGVRFLLVSLTAAVLGCTVAALVLVGAVDRSSFVAVPFAWVGCMALLAPADAWLRRRRVPMPLRSVPVVIAGAIGFAGAGWLLSGGVTGTAVMGGVYGMVTAACWSALTAITVRRTCER